MVPCTIFWCETMSGSVSKNMHDEIRVSVRPLFVEIFVPNCTCEELARLLSSINTAKIQLNDGYLTIESDDIYSIFIHRQFKLSTGRLVNDYVTILRDADNDDKIFLIINTDADEEGIWYFDTSEAVKFVCEFLEITLDEFKTLLLETQNATDILDISDLEL